MKKIQDALKTLTQLQHNILIHAHGNCLEKYIEYSPGKYVGVYSHQNPNLQIIEEYNSYSCGTIRKNGET